MRVLTILSLLSLGITAASTAHAAGGAWEMRLPGAFSIEALPPGATLTPLANVTSDRDAKVYGLSLLRNSAGAPVGLYMAEMKKRGATAEVRERYRAGGATDGKPYLFTDIAKPAGVTLLEAQGRKVLLLQGAYDSKGGQARLHLRYLSNGIWMSYGTCDVALKSQNGAFWLQNAYTGKRVTAAKVITSTFGVDTLEGICPAQ